MSRFADLSAVVRSESKKKGRKPKLGIIVDPGGMAKYFSAFGTFITDGNTYDGLILEGSAPVINRSMDRLGGLGVVSNLTFAVPNQEQFSDIFATYPDPRGLSVDAYLYFDDDTPILDAERIHVFSGEISEMPTISYDQVGFTAKGKAFRGSSKIGSLLTDADASGGFLLPNKSQGKMAPIIIGDHRFLINVDSDRAGIDKTDWVAESKNNPSPMVALGDDEYLIAGHQIYGGAGSSEASMKSEGDSIWAFDNRIQRMVEVPAANWALVQNTDAGAIVSITPGTYYDYRLPSAVNIDLGAEPWVNPENMVDGDVTTSATVTVTSGSGAGVLDILFAPLTEDIPQSEVDGTAVFALVDDTSSSWITDPSKAILSASNDEALLWTSEAINRFEAHQGMLPFSTSSTVDINFTHKGGGSHSVAVSAVYMRVEYSNEEVFDFYWGGRGMMYDANITARTEGDEDHFDSGNSGEVIENAAGVVEWIFRDYDGKVDADFNLPSLNRASNDLSFSKLSFSIIEQIWIDDLLNDLLPTAGAAMFYNFEDKITLEVFTQHDQFNVSGQFGPSGEEIYDFSPHTPFKIVAGTNDAIDFTEGGAELNATLTAGSYTGAGMATEIETQLEAIGADSYTVSYSQSTHKITIANDTANFGLFWYSGSNRGASAGAILGFTGDSLSLGANLLNTANADSPNDGEGDLATAWTGSGSLVLSSETFIDKAAAGTVPVVAFNGAYFVRADVTAGSEHASQSFTTVNTSRYLFKGAYQYTTTTVKYALGTSAGGGELIAAVLPHIDGQYAWGYAQSGFTATGVSSYISFIAQGTGDFYFDKMECKLLNGATYTSDIAVDEDMLATQPVMKTPFPDVNEIDQEVITDLTISHYFNHAKKSFQSEEQDTNTSVHTDGITSTISNSYTKDQNTAKHHLYFLLSRQHRQYWGTTITAKINAIGAERWDKINIRHPIGAGMFTTESIKRWLVLGVTLDFNGMEMVFSTEEI